MPLFQELKRRNVFRVAALYLAVSWLVVQVAETLFPVFEIGPGAVRITVILLAIGFWPAAIVSWLFELTPEGFKPDDGEDRDPGFSRKTRERLNQVVIVSLLLAVTYFAVDKFVLSVEVPAASAEVSIAVMPFENLSGNDDMQFFSDGVAEDILGQLSRTAGLRCVSRSSSFALRDAGMTTATVGQTLGVSHVLTGSLREHDESVRISVRLIEVDSDQQTWTDVYDGDMDDVFELQDSISRAVVLEVAPALVGAVPDASPAVPSEDYVDYLRARHLYLQGRDAGDANTVRRAQEMLIALVDHNPDYALAHAAIADTWGALAIQGAERTIDAYPKARAAAERAIDIDDQLAEAWFALGDVQFEFDWDLEAAGRSYRRALERAPQDVDGIRGYAYFLASTARTDQAVLQYRRSFSIDPLSRRGYRGLYMAYVVSGRLDEAEAVLQEIAALNPDAPVKYMRIPIHLIRREFDVLSTLVPPEPATFFDFIVSAYALRGRGFLIEADSRISEGLRVETPIPKYRAVAIYYASFGDNDRALDYLAASISTKEIVLSEALITPQMADLRKDPRFWALIEEAGMKPLSELALDH